MRSTLYRLAALLAVMGSVGCATYWAKKEQADDYSLPRKVTLYVVMSDEVADGDSGLAAAVVETLEADLKEDGYAVELVVARKGEAPPVPRIELQILDSRSGSAGARNTANVLWGTLPGGVASIAAADSIAIDCRVVLDRASKPVFSGRIKNQILAGSTGQDGVAMGRKVGEEIADTLAD